MPSMNDQIIETFRTNAGVVGGHFEGKRLVLLHYVGRRSGQERVTPAVAASDGDAVAPIMRRAAPRLKTSQRGGVGFAARAPLLEGEFRWLGQTVPGIFANFPT